ncbi:hypothetical protein FM112_15560 [Gulosibacter sp. 10]|nr:hypothetical protein FM112_15560 [Gulosibacter sp. 10]
MAGMPRVTAVALVALVPAMAAMPAVVRVTVVARVGIVPCVGVMPCVSVMPRMLAVAFVPGVRRGLAAVSRVVLVLTPAAGVRGVVPVVGRRVSVFCVLVLCLPVPCVPVRRVLVVHAALLPYSCRSGRYCTARAREVPSRRDHFDRIPLEGMNQPGRGTRTRHPDWASEPGTPTMAPGRGAGGTRGRGTVRAGGPRPMPTHPARPARTTGPCNPSVQPAGAAR